MAGHLLIFIAKSFYHDATTTTETLRLVTPSLIESKATSTAEIAAKIFFSSNILCARNFLSSDTEHLYIPKRLGEISIGKVYVFGF